MHAPQRTALEEAGQLLRELGHEVIARDPDYPPNAVAHALSRYFRGVYDDVDVVITPGTATGPSRIGEYQKRGAISTLTLVAARAPFQAMFNVTGQPAAAVPWGRDGTGVPTSIQLVGKPFDEATLLSLSAQIEKTCPWAHRRPPAS